MIFFRKTAEVLSNSHVHFQYLFSRGASQSVSTFHTGNAIVSKDGTRIIFLKHESVKTGISGEKKSGVGLRVGSRKSKCNTVVFLYQPYTDPGKPVSPQSTPEL